VVRHNEQRCLHCQLCVQACSFGNIDYAEVSLSEAPDSPEKGPRPDRPRSSEPTQGQAAIIKCDLCGYGDASDANACYPRCVQACPSRALLLCRVDPIGDLEVVDA
jgi:Fe-S-cluster-containing hydrogenase component 2